MGKLKMLKLFKSGSNLNSKMVARVPS